MPSLSTDTRSTVLTRDELPRQHHAHLSDEYQVSRPLYWEKAPRVLRYQGVSVPAAVSIFPATRSIKRRELGPRRAYYNSHLVQQVDKGITLGAWH